MCSSDLDDLMDGEFTVYDTLDRVAVGDIRTRLRDILGAFLFRGEDVYKRQALAFLFISFTYREEQYLVKQRK